VWEPVRTLGRGGGAAFNPGRKGGGFTPAGRGLRVDARFVLEGPAVRDAARETE